MRKFLGVVYLTFAVLFIGIAIVYSGHPLAWWGYLLAIPNALNGLYRLLTEDV
jgi:hypothetical protein